MLIVSFDPVFWCKCFFLFCRPTRGNWLKLSCAFSFCSLGGNRWSKLTSLSHLKENPECYVFISDWKRLRALSARSFSALWLDTPESETMPCHLDISVNPLFMQQKQLDQMPDRFSVLQRIHAGTRNDQNAESHSNLSMKGDVDNISSTWSVGVALTLASPFCSTGCQVGKTLPNWRYCFGRGSGAIHAVCLAAIHFKILSQTNNDKMTLSEVAYAKANVS